MNKCFRIVLVEDDEILRDTYSCLLMEQSHYEVVNKYSSAEEAIEHINKDYADVYIVDVSLKGISGIDAIAEIKRRSPRTHVVMLSSFTDEETINAAYANGASCYCTKDTPFQKIVETIKRILQVPGTDA
jgi:DNA-binding NarL/FixJ family response regulator